MLHVTFHIVHSRKADAVVARPVEKAIVSGSDRPEAVYAGEDGAVVDRVGAVAPVDGSKHQYGADSASVHSASVRQKRASGQLSIKDALSKRTKS
jgi:hypothetical protein